MDSEGDPLHFSTREGIFGAGVIGATETIGIKLEPEIIVNLEPPRPAIRRPDHTYDVQTKPNKATASKPPGQSRADHSYFGKVANETELQRTADLATVVNKSDFFKVKDHSYMGRGGMVVKEEPE